MTVEASASAATGVVGNVRPAHDSLTSGRTLLDPFLRAAVGSMPASMGRIAGYHLGYLDERGAAVFGHPGKAVRPTLVLLAAEAVGGSVEAALPAAAALELVHNFTLLHDDVIDRDLVRRHRPTTWAVFGIGPAILAGDALLALAYEVLATSGHAAAPGAAKLVSTVVLGLIEGQSADLSFEARTDVDLSECLAMSERKTALLLSCACSLGGSFGGGRPAQVEQLRRFGLHMGFVFQLVDDLLGIWGDAAATGKSVYSDLEHRKKSLPVVAALTSGTPAGEELAALYRRGEQLAGADLVRAAELVEQAGGRAWAEAQRDVHLGQALVHLDRADLDHAAADELRSLAQAISRRDR